MTIDAPARIGRNRPDIAATAPRPPRREAGGRTRLPADPCRRRSPGRTRPDRGRNRSSRRSGPRCRRGRRRTRPCPQDRRADRAAGPREPVRHGAETRNTHAHGAGRPGLEPLDAVRGWTCSWHSRPSTCTEPRPDPGLQSRSTTNLTIVCCASRSVTAASGALAPPPGARPGRRSGRWPSGRLRRSAGHPSCLRAQTDAPCQSIATTGSSPTTQASWPGGSEVISPGPASSSVPSDMTTWIRPLI